MGFASRPSYQPFQVPGPVEIGCPVRAVIKHTYFTKNIAVFNGNINCSSGSSSDHEQTSSKFIPNKTCKQLRICLNSAGAGLQLAVQTSLPVCGPHCVCVTYIQAKMTGKGSNELCAHNNGCYYCKLSVLRPCTTMYRKLRALIL